MPQANFWISVTTLIVVAALWSRTNRHLARIAAAQEAQAAALQQLAEVEAPVIGAALGEIAAAIDANSDPLSIITHHSEN